MTTEQRQRPVAGEPPQAHQRYVTIEEMDSTEVGLHLRQGVFILPQVDAAATTTEDATDGEAHAYVDAGTLFIEVYVASLDQWLTVGVADPLTIGQIDVTTLNATTATVGTHHVTGDLEIDGDLNHDGTEVGFFGVTPTTRPASTADIKDALALLGLLTNGGASPLNLDSGALTAGATNVSTLSASSSVQANGVLFANAGFDHVAGTLRFWNGAGQTSKPAITGSRGGNAALASLLTALATYGLITDSSSA